jgi:large subunit ribosomal protein L5e
MPFQKIVKDKAYFKRFQVQYRRRREGKTDYYARKRLVTQDKNKYNSPKYRLVVRITNKDIVAQIISSKIAGDFVLSSAYARELSNFGMPVSHTSYAAGYATGLLLARRVLKKLGLADKYAGNNKEVGEDYNVEAIDDGPNPFYCILDCGLHRTTTGARIFSVLKGVADGGVEIPHGINRFVGYNKEEKKLNADILKKYIFGGHVSDYMTRLQKEEPEKYATHFSSYIKAGFTPANVQDKWKATHAAIRSNPDHVKKAKATTDKDGKPVAQKNFNKKRLNLGQRRNRIRQQLAYRARVAQKKDE